MAVRVLAGLALFFAAAAIALVIAMLNTHYVDTGFVVVALEEIAAASCGGLALVLGVAALIVRRGRS